MSKLTSIKDLLEEEYGYCPNNLVNKIIATFYTPVQFNIPVEYIPNVQKIKVKVL